MEGTGSYRCLICLAVAVFSLAYADQNGSHLLDQKVVINGVIHQEHLIMLHDHHVTLEDEMRMRVSDIHNYALRYIRQKRDHEEASRTIWEILKVHHIRRIVILHVRASDDVIRQLRSHADVKVIEPNVVHNIHSSESCSQQKTGRSVWGLSRITAVDTPTSYESAAYSYPENVGEGVDVYVIDSGVYVDHVDFEGRAVWGYTAEGLRNEGDLDLNGHGTHVAGTVASKTYGVAKKAKVIAVKVLDQQGSGDSAGIIEGIVWVYSQYIDKLADGNGRKPKVVINMSLGGNFSFQGIKYVREAVIIACIDVGIPFVVAAGNDFHDACLDSPARLSGVVTVGATDIHDGMTDFTNYGPCVDIFAPGQDILSTAIGGSSATESKSGTSMAAPHVTGVIAAYLSQISQSPSPYAISAWLFETALKGQILMNKTITDIKTITYIKTNISHNRLLHLPCPIDDNSCSDNSSHVNDAILAIVCVIMVLMCLTLIVVAVVICRTPTLRSMIENAFCCRRKAPGVPASSQAYDNEAYAERSFPPVPPVATRRY